MPAALGLRAGLQYRQPLGDIFKGRERTKNYSYFSRRLQKKEQFLTALVYILQRGWLSSVQRTNNIFLTPHCLTNLDEIQQATAVKPCMPV